MAASYSPRVRHFELKFQSFADEGFPRDHASETQKLEWNLELGDYNLCSLGVFSAFYGEQQKKKIHFFVVRKDIACVKMPSPLKKGGRQSLSSIFSGERGASVQNYTTLLIHITHWKKKYTRTAKTGGLNGLRSAKKKMWRIYRNRRRL